MGWYAALQTIGLVLLLGGMALLYTLTSDCATYGACLGKGNGVELLPKVAAFAAGLVVLSIWTYWVCAVLGWRLRKRR